MLNVEFANLHCNNNDKKRQKNKYIKKKKKKIMPSPRFEQNPRTHPLRHGGLCEIQFKIINIYA